MAFRHVDNSSSVGPSEAGKKRRAEAEHLAPQSPVDLPETVERKIQDEPGEEESELPPPLQCEEQEKQDDVLQEHLDDVMMVGLEDDKPLEQSEIREARLLRQKSQSNNVTNWMNRSDTIAAVGKAAARMKRRHPDALSKFGPFMDEMAQGPSLMEFIDQIGPDA